MKKIGLKFFLPTLIASAITVPLSAESKIQSEAPTLSIYQGNIALIQETRDITLNQAEPQLFLSNISPAARTSTLLLSFEGAAKEAPIPTITTKKLNRNILSPNTMIESYLGKTVDIISFKDGKEQRESAKLVSNNNGLLLQYHDRIELNLPQDARIAFPSIPEGLTNTPVLSVQLSNLPQTDQNYQANLLYLTDGISWSTDYIAKIDDETRKLHLTAWANIQNQSGIDYKNAHIRLIAGEPNIIQSYAPIRQNYALASMAMEMDSPMARSAKITPQSLGDFYLYTIPTASTLKNNEETQLVLFESAAIPFIKTYHFDNQIHYGRAFEKSHQLQNAEVSLNFTNDKAAHLGFPLPFGIIRLYQATDNLDTFLGEATLQATPNGQSVTLTTGNAFDITLNRSQSDCKVINKDECELTVKLVIANAKKEAADIIVSETPYVTPNLNWEIIQESQKYALEGDKIQWAFTLPKESETTITYTIRYTQFE